MSVLELFDRPIAFHRCFVTITGSITASVMLSQAFYWNKRTTVPGGWFWKTQEEWTDETGLTRYEQETARKVLKSLGIFEEKKQGVPAKLYFKVNVEKLYELLEIVEKTSCKPQESQYVEKPHTSVMESNIQERGKTTDKDDGKPHYITETTSEITTDINNPPADAVVKKPKTVDQILFEFGITDQLAHDFKKHRKIKKGDISETVMKGYQREAEKAGISIIAAVTESIERGWQGFRATWHEKENQIVAQAQKNNGFYGKQVDSSFKERKILGRNNG